MQEVTLIRNKIKAIGRAMLALNLQNTHSGNISVRLGEDILITKTGSMKGHLEDRDIVLVGLTQPKTGLFQASSETGTHQRILAFAGAAIHAHSLAATIISYRHQVLTPIDALGARYLGKVPIIEFEYPVGSPEMEEEIPRCLASHPAMIIKTHGPFTQGKNLEEAFFRLAVLDYSAQVLLWSELLGHNPQETLSKFLNKYPPLPDYQAPTGYKDSQDEELLRQFKRTAADVFHLQLSPFHTGSLSVRDGEEMLYCPRLAAPSELADELEIWRVSLSEKNSDYFLSLHQSVYRLTSAKAAIFTHSPWGTIQSLFQLSQRQDRIIPADAEGSYFYPAIAVVPPGTTTEEIISKASRYKMVAIAGLGVLALGHTPGHVSHHPSSLKNICFILSHLAMMQHRGLIEKLDSFLDPRGKSW